MNQSPLPLCDKAAGQTLGMSSGMQSGRCTFLSVDLHSPVADQTCIRLQSDCTSATRPLCEQPASRALCEQPASRAHLGSGISTSSTEICSGVPEHQQDEQALKPVAVHFGSLNLLVDDKLLVLCRQSKKAKSCRSRSLNCLPG